MNWFLKLFNIMSGRGVQLRKRVSTPIHIDEWIQTIEVLVPYIRQARYDFSPTRITTLDYDEYDLFEANSTLYQIDRLVNKIREYLLILQAYDNQFSGYPDILRNNEFTHANQAGLECHHTMIQLIYSFQKLSNEKKLSNEFISQAQALEMKCSILRQAIWHLNQFVMHYELNAQLNKISDFSISLKYSEKLKSKARELSNEQDHLLINSLINLFDMLNHSPGVIRNDVVKQTLEGLYLNIDLLIGEFLRKSIHKDSIFSCLYLISHQLESLRFSTNRKNYYSKDLFDKSKMAKRTLRKACALHPVGREFLEATTFYHWQPHQKNDKN